MMLVEINDLLGLVALGLVILGLKFAVAFVLRIVRDRGDDLIVTHQVDGIDAEDPKEAVSKALDILKEEKRKGKVAGETVRIYMVRGDEEGLDEEERKKRRK